MVLLHEVEHEHVVARVLGRGAAAADTAVEAAELDRRTLRGGRGRVVNDGAAVHAQQRGHRRHHFSGVELGNLAEDELVLVAHLGGAGGRRELLLERPPLRQRRVGQHLVQVRGARPQ